MCVRRWWKCSKRLNSTSLSKCDTSQSQWHRTDSIKHDDATLSIRNDRDKCSSSGRNVRFYSPAQSKAGRTDRQSDRIYEQNTNEQWKKIAYSLKQTIFQSMAAFSRPQFIWKFFHSPPTRQSWFLCFPRSLFCCCCCCHLLSISSNLCVLYCVEMFWWISLLFSCGCLSPFYAKLTVLCAERKVLVHEQ